MDNFKSILHIEDDQIDALIMKRAFKLLEIPNALIHKIDGEQAIKYLMNEKNEKPGVILLDLHMPRMDGREFLKILTDNPDLNKIPVIILSSCVDREIVVDPNVFGFIFKSACFEDYVAAIKSELERLNFLLPV